MESSVTCLNCGGRVKPLKEAKGDVGACEQCGTAEKLTKTRSEEIDRAIQDGEPSGGVAPALTAEEMEAAREGIRPDLTDAEGAPLPGVPTEVLTGHGDADENAGEGGQG